MVGSETSGLEIVLETKNRCHVRQHCPKVENEREKANFSVHPSLCLFHLTN